MKNVETDKYSLTKMHLKLSSVILPPFCPEMEELTANFAHVTCVHIFVTKWCIVGYLSESLWDLCDRMIKQPGSMGEWKN